MPTRGPGDSPCRRAGAPDRRGQRLEIGQRRRIALGRRPHERVDDLLAQHGVQLAQRLARGPAGGGLDLQGKGRDQRGEGRVHDVSQGRWVALEAAPAPVDEVPLELVDPGLARLRLEVEQDGLGQPEHAQPEPLDLQRQVDVVEIGPGGPRSARRPARK